MASNLFSKFLPADVVTPSIYEALRHQDDSEESDIEERAGMAADEDTGVEFRDLEREESPDVLKTSRKQGGSSQRNGQTPSEPESLPPRQSNEEENGYETENVDDEPPESLLIEAKDEPVIRVRSHPASSDADDPAIAKAKAQLDAAMSIQRSPQRSSHRLQREPLPPRIHPRRTPGPTPTRAPHAVDPKEQALWMWTNVSNLDNFLRDVYDYYLGNGIWCITMQKMLNLFTSAFVVAFSVFLLSCIDFSSIPRSKSMEQIMIPKCADGWSTTTNVFIWFFSLYWIYKFFETLYDLRRLRKLQKFFTHLLGVRDGDIQTVAWQEIVKQLMELRDLNPTTAAEPKKSHQRFIGTQSKQRMDAHDIANRLMRRENYLIAIINKDILDLTLPIPFLRKRPFFSKMLQWNLNLCILDHVFDERGQVRPLFLKDAHRRALSESLRRRFIFAGFMNALCAPFIILFFILYFFFRYFNEYQKNPSQIGSRQYTPLAEWKFREFNELWHFFERRINMSHPFASRYMDQFPKEKTVQVSKFVAFVAGALTSVLAVASLVDPESFLSFEITPERTVLFYLGVFGSIWAIARGAIPAENIVFDPEYTLRDVVSYTRYLPAHWAGHLHTNEVRAEFAELYKMKILIFVEELISILLTPFVLWLSLPACSDRIIDFFREFTVHVDGLGYVCSFAVFDFKKGGNQTTHKAGSAEQKLREEYYSAKDGKMLASYYGFIDNYVTSQRPGAPYLHPEARQSFHAPPTFPAMMASNWINETQPGGKASKAERHVKATERSMTNGPTPGSRSVCPRTPRFGPTLERSSQMGSMLLDPQHQPSQSSLQRKATIHSKLRNSRRIFGDQPGILEDEAENDVVPGSTVEGVQDDDLSESWKTTQADNQDGQDEDEAETADQALNPGVLDLVYQFSRAQNETIRGGGMNI